MRFESGRRERFLPYRYVRAGLDLRIQHCVLDGKDEVAPDRDAHLLELDVPWSEAKLTLAIHVSEQTRAAVLPDPSREEALGLLVVAQCPGTFLRSAMRAAVTFPETQIELSLRRDDLAGSVHVQAFLVRAAVSRGSPGFANASGARLADSRPWELRVDRVRETRGEYLDVRYLHFTEEGTIAPHDRKNLYLLQMDQEVPELWLNADHERIVAVLNSKGTVGRHARIREVAFDQIEYGVWTQLFLRSARDYVESAEVTWPWQEAVLDLLLRDLFPEVRTATGRRERLADEWKELPALLACLDAALQRRGELSTHFLRLVEESEDGS